MDRVDGNSSSENEQLSGTNVRTQNTGNEEENNSVALGYDSTTGRLLNNTRQSEDSHMYTLTMANVRNSVCWNHDV